MPESIMIKPAVSSATEGLDCPLCDQLAHQHVMSYPGHSALFRNRTVARCARCELTYMYPMASTDALNAYYNTGNYWGHVLDTTPFDIPTYHHQAKARAEFIFKRANLPAAAQVLDIGAGYGVLENYLKKGPMSEASFFAIEPDQKAQQSLEKHNIRWESDVTAFGDKTFDLVILSHVLEHMNDPVGYLKRLRRQCHAGTYLFIEVPNEDFRFKFDLESHVLFFNPKTLSAVLGAANYSVVSVETCGLLRADQRAINERNLSRQKWIDRLPFRGALKRLKRFLKPAPAAGPSFDPFSVPDQFACTEYGADRIWVRCLAKLEA